MIKSVTVTNHLGDNLVLELARPELSGFLVQGIDGLGPVKASINTTKMANADGSSYNSAYLDQRDITFQLLFYTDGSELIEDIRHRSYKYFPLKKQVTIRVETDNRISETTGYVESNEPNIFSNAEGCTIVVACPDPYFYSVRNNETIFSGIDASFEFPLINNSSSEPLLEMSTVKNKKEANIFNAGDSDVGLTMVMHATGDVENVSIYNLDTREAMTLDTSKMPTIDYHIDALTRSGISWEKGSRLIPTTGETIASSQNQLSEYIPVIPGTTIEYSLYWISSPHDDTPIWVYDENKKGIQHITLTDNNRQASTGKLKLQDNARYIRISLNYDYVDTSSVMYIPPDIPPAIYQGDTITINTTRGNKSITLLRRGKIYNILNCVTRDSKWFTLNRGDNLFAFKADTGEEYLQFRTENKVVYTGV